MIRCVSWVRQAARLLTAATVLGLVACASPPTMQGQVEGAFERAGRFAVHVENRHGEPDAVQGGFAWRDTGKVLWLDLANPLGSTLARVEVRPGQAVLTRSNGETEAAPNPDALVAQVLGSPIPVSGLRDWLRGQPGRNVGAIAETDSQGRATRFEQQGWQVNLSRYDELGPRLLQLKRSEADRTINVRLVIDSN